MINTDQSALLLYCCEDVKSHRSGADTVPLMRVTYDSILVMSILVKMNLTGDRTWNL